MFSFGGKKKQPKKKQKKEINNNPEGKRKKYFSTNIKIHRNIWAAVIHQKEMSSNLNKVKRQREITLNLIRSHMKSPPL